MKTYLSLFAATALAVGISAALPVSADTVVVAKPSYSYVYYRDHEIYYRPETKMYFWRENGKWQSANVLPAYATSYVTRGGTTIMLDTERPYERHDTVVTKYTSTNRAGDTVTTEKTTRPDGSSTTVTTTTKRKYVYYADHDIYFAPDRNTYYWRADGRWYSGSELPTAARAYVTDGGITIELDTDTPYTRHDYVVTHYKDD